MLACLRIGDVNLSFGAAVALRAVVLLQVRAKRAVGIALIFRIDCRINVQTSGVGFLLEDVEHERSDEFGHVFRVQRSVHAGRRADLFRGDRQSGLDRLIDLMLILFVRDIAEISHAAEHVVAANLRALRAGKGVVDGGRSRKSCERGGFADRELLNIFTVISSARGGKTVSSVA